MSSSLRDQLLGLGYKPAAKPERAPEPRKPEAGRKDPGSRKSDTGRRDDPSARKPDSGRRPDGASGRDADRQRPAGAKPGDRARPALGRTDSRSRRAPAAIGAKSQEEIDLGKAYALRAQKEKDDRIEAERLKQEEAKRRREAKAKLAELLKDKSLNDPAAEIARHFEYGGKIKRIYVTAEQLSALNAGEFGVAQMDGRYLLIPAALLAEAEAIFPPAVALKVDPNAAPTDDPYSDPAYQVPDDLVW
ncbi:MAG: DUF2058 family protein [Arenimonas sp.]|jgi:uncharacterized protein YaiL (DUF2058 family)